MIVWTKCIKILCAYDTAKNNKGFSKKRKKPNMWVFSPSNSILKEIYFGERKQIYVFIDFASLGHKETH